jgi:hypothetical protein
MAQEQDPDFIDPIARQIDGLDGLQWAFLISETRSAFLNPSTCAATLQEIMGRFPTNEERGAFAGSNFSEHPSGGFKCNLLGYAAAIPDQHPAVIRAIIKSVGDQKRTHELAMQEIPDCSGNSYVALLNLSGLNTLGVLVENVSPESFRQGLMALGESGNRPSYYSEFYDPDKLQLLYDRLGSEKTLAFLLMPVCETRTEKAGNAWQRAHDLTLELSASGSDAVHKVNKWIAKFRQLFPEQGRHHEPI